MRLREKVLIKADASAIWSVLANPTWLPIWNSKAIRVEAPDRELRLGDRYRCVYKMTGRERPTDVEVIDCIEPRRLVLQESFDKAGRQHSALVAYELVQQSPGVTKMVTWIDLRHAGIPRFWQLVIWLISRFGTQVGPSGFEKLASLVKESQTP